MNWISWFTDLQPRLVVGFIGVIAIAISRRYRLAALTAAAAAVTAIPVNGLDLVGGIVADRIRPNGAPFLAYPSGHTLGTIVQYGFGIFLALRLGLRMRFLLPLVAILAFPLVFVGPARVLVGVRWSTDVLGAYLLGTATVIVLVLLFDVGEQWLARRELLAR
jgi:undecaprenyl-diphosphatase